MLSSVITVCSHRIIFPAFSPCERNWLNWFKLVGSRYDVRIDVRCIVVPFHFHHPSLVSIPRFTPDSSVRTTIGLTIGVNFIRRVYSRASNLYRLLSNMENVELASDEYTLKFKRLSDKALSPTRGSTRAAGYDLKSAYDYIVPARGKELIKTDLQIEVPRGCYGRVAPRSGLAWKNFIDVGAGVIDEDYRGNVGVILFNHSPNDFEVKRGDRIAQLICERIYYPALKEIQNLSETERGEGGFGSTGV